MLFKLTTTALLVLVLSLSGCPSLPNPCVEDYFMLLPSDKAEWPDERVEC